MFKDKLINAHDLAMDIAGIQKTNEGEGKRAENDQERKACTK